MNKKTTKPSGKSNLVVARVRKGDVTEIRLDSGKKLEMRPFVPIGAGDQIVVDQTNRSVSVVLDAGTTFVELSRPWSEFNRVTLGHEQIDIRVKEVETEQELSELSSLKQFHYRGDLTAGRVVPLIAVVSHRLLPRVIGFIEITSAMLVNSARKGILDRPYSDPERKVRSSHSLWQIRRGIWTKPCRRWRQKARSPTLS